MATEASYHAAQEAGDHQGGGLQEAIQAILSRALPDEDVNDTNYIFLRFVRENLPAGLIGIIFAIIFLSAWEVSRRRLIPWRPVRWLIFINGIFEPKDKPMHEYRVSQWYTLGWGVFAS